MSTKVITGTQTRLSFANIWEPKSVNGSEPKYSVSLIIPKSDTKTIDAINKAINEAYSNGVDKLKGNNKTAPSLESIKTPLRDGDKERPDDEAYKGCYFVNCNSKERPQIVDRDVNPILEQSDVYSGCYARVSINAFAYNASGNKGIAFGLGNIQKIADGDRLGGRSSANEDFQAFGDSDAEDDFLN